MMRFLNRPRPHLACGLLLILCVLPGPAAEAPPPVLPDADYPRLVAFSADVIRTALKGKPDKRAAERARTAAVMIAAYAQQNLSGRDGQQRATMRDAALELAALIKAKEFDKALKQLDALPNVKADAKVKKEKLKMIGAAIELDDLMAQFRQPARGGLGIEVRLDDLGAAEGGTVPAKELDDLLLWQAYLVAVAAEITAEHTPEDKDKVKNWQTYAAAMRQHASTLAAAAKAKEGKAAFRALEQLNQACAKCHKDFR
jgi:Cytochrome C'